MTFLDWMQKRFQFLAIAGALTGTAMLNTGCDSNVNADALSGGGGTTIVQSGPSPTIRPLLISSQTAVDFSTQSIGVSKSVTFSVLNAGTSSAVVQTPALPTGEVTLSSNNCLNTTLAVGSACSITLTYLPATVATISGYLTIPYADTNGIAYSYVLAYSGNGILAPPVITSAPTTKDFGTVATSATASQLFSISNASSGSATFQAATITGSGYTITTDNCSTHTLISTSTACTISILYSPLYPGSSLGQLILHYTNSSGTALTSTISFSGYGDLPQPVLTISPSPQNFGSVATNAHSDQTILVTNNTSVTATMGTPTISGSGYTIPSTTCAGISLSASASCTVIVRFTPVAVGAVAGTLTVPFSSVQNVSYTATDTLAGTGVTPTVSFSFSGFTGVPSTDSTGLTATGVTLQWTAQSAAAYYVVTRTGGSSGTVVSTHLGPTTTATYNVGALAPNTAYQFKVNAYDSNDTSDGNNNLVTITTPNVAGSTFMGWSDAVATGSVYTDIGTVDNTKGFTGTNRIERNIASISGFDSSAVDTSTSIITTNRNFATGSRITLYGDGTAPGGLTNGTVYYVINVSTTQVKLASTYANALAGTAIAISTTGSGNMTLQPKAVAKLGWELFTFTPTATASGYNIYRSTTLGGTYSLIGTSTGQSYADYQVSDATTYFYKVQPTTSGTETTAPATSDSIITVYVPSQNMALVHRWITNREVCTNLIGVAWPAGINRSDNYSCAYTWGGGYAPNTTYSKTRWDLGYSYAVDRWQNGCKMNNYGSSVPSSGTGSVGDVFLFQGGGTTSANNSMECYIKDASIGWINTAAGTTTNAERAVMRTNYPGYAPSPINQSLAYSFCQNRTAGTLTDGNGSTKLRLMRMHELLFARAAQGTNVNYRSPSVLANVFNGVNLPVNGSCNMPLNGSGGNQLDGVTFPNPSTYSLGYYTLNSGSILTSNCYSRYSIYNLWDNTYEWTTGQYYATAAGNGVFTASSLDAGDNLMENIYTNGTMANSNVYTGNQDNIFGAYAGQNKPVIAILGIQTVTASTTLGSRVIDNSLSDFGTGTNLTTWVSKNNINSNGISTGGMSPYMSTARFTFSFQIPTYNFDSWGNREPIANRCMGQVP